MAHPLGAPKTPGSGRKKGVPNKKTAAMIAAVEASGLTPLEVMLQNMRGALAQGNSEFAQSCARDAAPYIHSRLSAMEVKADVDITETIEVTNDMRWRAIQAALDRVAK